MGENLNDHRFPLYSFSECLKTIASRPRAVHVASWHQAYIQIQKTRPSRRRHRRSCARGYFLIMMTEVSPVLHVVRATDRSGYRPSVRNNMPVIASAFIVLEKELHKPVA